MTSADSSTVDKKFLANAMASSIQIAGVALLLYWCFTIVSPFLSILVWGLILSVALYPTHLALSARLGQRESLSAVVLVLVGLVVILLPSWILFDSTVEGLRAVAANLEDGSAQIRPPNESVADWPVIGERVYEVWSAAAVSLESTLNEFEPQLRSFGQQALAFAGHGAVTVLQFVLSVIVAGVLLTKASGGYRAARNIASSLVGVERGPQFADLSIGTIRSVMKGVLGVALIQAFFAAIGLIVAGIPAAGIWAGAVLILAIVQLPPLIVLGPIAFWYFSVADPVPATVFLVYALVISISDTFLKPLLLGRGVEVPMLVILIGAIGGAIAQGIVGLFIGAVILALGYEVFTAWMAPSEEQPEIVDG